MADQNDSAVVAGDDLLQQIQCLDVEIVGRLIEDQQVGRPRHDACQDQPRPLAAGKVLDRRADLLGLEQEILHVARDVTLLAIDEKRFAASVGEVVGKRVVGIEVLSLLVQRGDFEICPEPHRARIWIELPRQHLQQRRLSGTVGSHKAYPVAPVYADGEGRDDKPVSITLGDRFCLDHQLSGFPTFRCRRLD